MPRHISWQRLVFVVGVALLATVMGGTLHKVFAHPEGFVFTPLVFLNTPTPGVSNFSTRSTPVALIIEAMSSLAPS